MAKSIGMFTRQAMIEAYRDGKSPNQIAREFGVHKDTVKEHLEIARVRMRDVYPKEEIE